MLSPCVTLQLFECFTRLCIRFSTTLKPQQILDIFVRLLDLSGLYSHLYLFLNETLNVWEYSVIFPTIFMLIFNMFPSLNSKWISTLNIKFSLPLWSNITSISTCFPHWLNISNLSEIQHWSIDIKEIFNVEVSKQVENASLYMNLWREYWRLLYLAPIDWTTTINWKANLTPMMEAYDSLKPTRGKISFQKD
jgi:hypothetical protein